MRAATGGDRGPNLFVATAGTGAETGSRVGGVIYDPAVKGLAYRPADLGNYSRARVEALADNITPVLIGDTGVIDGWQMSESGRGAVRGGASERVRRGASGRG